MCVIMIVGEKLKMEPIVKVFDKTKVDIAIEMCRANHRKYSIENVGSGKDCNFVVEQHQNGETAYYIFNIKNENILFYRNSILVG